MLAVTLLESSSRLHDLQGKLC